jgi:hypothetical protein
MIRVEKWTKKIISSILILCLGIYLSTPINAADYFIPHLEVGSSAKMIGIGQLEGFDNSSATVFNNPAGLYKIKQLSFSAFQTQFLETLDYLNLATAIDTSIVNIGFGYMQLSVDDIPHTGINDEGFYYVIDYYKYSNSVIKTAISYSILKDLHIGLGLNMYSTKLKDVTGSGMGLDFGMIYNSKNWDLTTNIKNIPALGSEVKYSDDTKETLPMQLTISHRYSLTQDFNVYSQLKKSTFSANSHKKSPLKHLGIEYKPVWLNKLAYLSFGYRDYYVLYSIKENVVLGFGLELPAFQIHLSYEKSDYHLKDNKFYLSIAYGNNQ